MTGALSGAALGETIALCRWALARLEGGTGDPPMSRRLDRLVAAFGLDRFERDVLILAAGLELDDDIRDAVRALDPGGAGHLCFAPLLSRMQGPWAALSPDGPLRRYRLIEIGPNRPLARAPITIDERILHHLVGLDPLDARLAPILVRAAPGGWLPISLAQLAATTAEAVSGSAPPVIEIAGDDPRDARLFAAGVVAAAGAAEEAGQTLWRINGADIPTAPEPRALMATLWAREAALAGRALLVEGTAAGSALDALADAAPVLFVHGGSGPLAGRPRLRVLLPALDAAEQTAVWHKHLGPGAERLNGALSAVTGQFRLGYSDVVAAAAVARPALARDPEGAGDTLWQAARGVARPRLRDLATEIPPCARWGDIVLPKRELRTLHAICAQVRHRQQVYRDWGFAPEGGRGLGVTALFSGPSGSGKTMAAEVLAADLKLDLFRVDLSQVVSKYIGETEKNLATVFDAAEDGGAILLFDEADAILGKRSEVRDSHDRYANMEVSYLLQRMETYGGLALMTTNFRAALDKAFARRLRFVVEFPFPGYDERLEIWRRAFPEAAQTEGIDPARLARLGVAGGSIRSIALNAAFLAAQEGAPIRMAHLSAAAECECVKLEKTITTAETGGWA